VNRNDFACWRYGCSRARAKGDKAGGNKSQEEFVAWRRPGLLREATVVGSTPTGAAFLGSAAVAQGDRALVMSSAADSRHKDNRCGEGARYFVQASAPSALRKERLRSRSPPASQRSRSSNYKREPLVPIELAGMVRCRATSSPTRRAGRRSPATLYDFPPGAILKRGWTW
jgi:hypothetical protein